MRKQAELADLRMKFAELNIERERNLQAFFRELGRLVKQSKQLNKLITRKPEEKT